MSDYICPQCGRNLMMVRYNPDTMLNREQYFSQVAGDYYCEHCKGGEAKSGYRYFWESSLKDGADVRAWRDSVGARITTLEADLAAERARWAELRDWLDDLSTDKRLGSHARVIILDRMDALSIPADVVRCEPVSIKKVEGDTGYVVTVLVDDDGWSVDSRLRFAGGPGWLVKVKP